LYRNSTEPELHLNSCKPEKEKFSGFVLPAQTKHALWAEANKV